MKYADLHIHTNYSDGTCSPVEVLKEASARGLHCIAITDHDTVSAIGPALKKSSDFNIELIPGIEVSVEAGEYEVHLLGYFIDWQAAWFADKLQSLRKLRDKRALLILEKLQQQDISLNTDQLFQQARPESVGRLHIARILKREGFVHSIDQAFQKYLGKTGSCYVKKFRLTPTQAFEMIRRLRGLTVLAHPYNIGNDELIPEFVQLGLRGIEVYYSEQKQHVFEHYQNLAQKYNLLITGGSDWHGQDRERMLGKVKLPYNLVEQLKKEAEGLKK